MTDETFTIPADKMSVDNTLPEDWKEGTFVGRVMLPEGPAVVRLEANGHLTDITESFHTMSELTNADDPAQAAKEATGRDIGKLEDILQNTADDPTSKDRPRLVAPIDLQTVKAAGVTFAESLIERAVDESVSEMPKETDAEKQAVMDKKVEIRKQLVEILGYDPANKSPDQQPIQAGSTEALALLDHIIKPEAEGGLGLSKHYFEVGLGEMTEIFTKADTLASVGSGVPAGFLDSEKYGLNNPEPEAVLITSHTKDGKGGRIVGAALGNDINHRTIEGKSALLLGECKNQNGTCAIGPLIRLFDDSFNLDDVRQMDVGLDITNNGQRIYSGTNSMSQISRDPQKMVDQMYAHNKGYGDGAVLFCGTMCVPNVREDDGTDFAHKEGDIVTITSNKLGSLSNVMAHCEKVPQPEHSLGSLMKNLAERGLLAAKETWRAALGNRQNYHIGDDKGVHML